MSNSRRAGRTPRPWNAPLAPLPREPPTGPPELPPWSAFNFHDGPHSGAPGRLWHRRAGAPPPPAPTLAPRLRVVHRRPARLPADPAVTAARARPGPALTIAPRPAPPCATPPAARPPAGHSAASAAVAKVLTATSASGAPPGRRRPSAQALTSAPRRPRPRPPPPPPGAAILAARAVGRPGPRVRREHGRAGAPLPPRAPPPRRRSPSGGCSLGRGRGGGGGREARRPRRPGHPAPGGGRAGSGQPAAPGGRGRAGGRLRAPGAGAADQSPGRAAARGPAGWSRAPLRSHCPRRPPPGFSSSLLQGGHGPFRPSRPGRPRLSEPVGDACEYTRSLTMAALPASGCARFCASGSVLFSR